MAFKKGHTIGVGRIPWNKGKHGVRCGVKKGEHCSVKTEFAKGATPWNKGKKGLQISKRRGMKFPEVSGEKNGMWVSDRSLLKPRKRNAGSMWWKKQVRERDNHKCQIADMQCCGILEVHHIFPWAKFPELRDEISNGILLCFFHYPRKRSEELRLMPIFQEIISVKYKQHGGPT